MGLDEQLIEEVRKRPFLYDLALEDYKNLKKKDHAWQEVAMKIKLEAVKCKKRWKGLRDCYKRCKRQQTLKSGSGAESPKRKWCHMETLSFLDNVHSSRSTIGNIPTDETEIFEECITPDSYNDITQFDQINSDSTCSIETPTCSRVRKQNDRDNFQIFLQSASESIKKTCDAIVNQKPENSTTLLFKILASKIIESDMPLTEINKLESKVSALVFSEIEKYKESLEWL